MNYSIVIPHKNTPFLLKRCLDSIPNREDTQIIIVDDNSDNSIVDFSAFPGHKKINTEIIFSKEGKGAGFARNLGLKKALGKWIIFADSDDFFNYCINDILNEYKDANADIVFFKHNCVDSEKYINTFRAENFNKYIDLFSHKKRKAEYFLKYRNCVPWSKIFNREFIYKHSIFFDEIFFSNDMTFSYLAGFYSNKILTDDRAMYCTTITKGSIRNKKRTYDNRLDMLFVDAKRYKFLKKNYISTAGRNSFANCLIRFYFKDKKYYFNAKKILFELGYKKYEIFYHCLFSLLLLIPRKIFLGTKYE